MHPYRGPPPNPPPHPPPPPSPHPQHMPQPFVPIGTPNPAHYAASTYGQRPIVSTQGSAYPPDDSFRNAPNFIQPLNVPSRHSHAQSSAYPPMQDSIPTHPEFPMPQVRDHVPAAFSAPPPPMMQGPDTTHFPSHHSNAHVTPGHYASHTSQAPYMSRSSSHRGSGMSEATQYAPIVQTNRACVPLQPNMYVF